MKISICMAVFNGQNYLKDQLDSLINQTYQDWVLYIHDDGSTDNTKEIINQYCSAHPDKIVFFNDNIRCGGAKENFTYLLSKIDYSDYIMFCDQDDVWKEDKIQQFYDAIVNAEQEYPDLPITVFSDLTVVDENLNIIDSSMVSYQKLNPIIADTFNLLKCQNVITGCAMIFNHKALQLSSPIPDSALMHDWWIGLVCAKYGKNIYFNKATILYRQHSNNSVGSKSASLYQLLRKGFSFKIFSSYFSIKKMVLHLDKISFISFLYYKIKVTLIRFFK